MTYITGSHAVKVGFNRTHGFLQQTTYNNQPFQYRFLNGVPEPDHRVCDAVHVDQQRRQRSRALRPGSLDDEPDDRQRRAAVRLLRHQLSRADHRARAAPPEQEPELPGAGQPGVEGHHVSVGFVYDVTGNGKTALRVSFNKYLLGQTLNGLGSSPSPANALVTQATRTWNDRGGLGINNDYIPQCDFLNPAVERRVRGDEPEYVRDGRRSPRHLRSGSARAAGAIAR